MQSHDTGARRMASITSFIVMDVLEEALALQANGADIVHLEVGEPDFSPPAKVVEALGRAAAEGHTHYTHSLGHPVLREAIAAWYNRTYGVSVSPARIVVTPGTSGAFLGVLSVLLDPGEKLLLTDPGYPCYPNFARLLGIEPCLLPVYAEHGFLPDIDAVRRAISEHNVKVVMAASPNNPTGAILPGPLLKQLAELSVPLISDEIYHGLSYTEEPAHTALRFNDQAIVINGLSKRMAMTGLRIGWAIVPESLVRPMQKISQNVFICSDSISQQAAIVALTDPDCDAAAAQMAETYARRRRLLIDGLKSLGFILHTEPDGAFYVFADISPFAEDGYDFAFAMLRNAHVAITPGVDFGSNGTKRFVRFSYTTGEDRILLGLERIGRWLRQRGI